MQEHIPEYITEHMPEISVRGGGLYEINFCFYEAFKKK